MISLINEGLYAAIGNTLNEAPQTKEDFLTSTKAMVNHNLRMYYNHLQISQAHEVLAKHGSDGNVEHHKTKADHHVNKAGEFHYAARKQHQDMCAIHSDEHFQNETEHFTAAKNAARDHVGYKE